MDKIETQIRIIRLLTSRLEHICADSYWAHRASGLRGSLLNYQDNLEQNNPFDETYLSSLIEKSFEILIRAAAEF